MRERERKKERKRERAWLGTERERRVVWEREGGREKQNRGKHRHR